MGSKSPNYHTAHTQPFIRLLKRRETGIERWNKTVCLLALMYDNLYTYRAYTLIQGQNPIVHRGNNHRSQAKKAVFFIQIIIKDKKNCGVQGPENIANS